MKGYIIIPLELTDIDLTITETICLAVIWGFSQDKKSWYYGSQSYLAKCCRCSRRHIIGVLQRLEDLNLIIKRKGAEGEPCLYQANHETLHLTCELSSQGGVNSVPRGCEESSQGGVNSVHIDNIDNNIINTIDNIKRESIERKDTPFSKPSINEIQLYCDTQGLTIDVQHFYDYYESNGWKVGTNKMKDWRAAARNWARRESASPQKESVLEHNLKVMAELKRRHNG